jgi:methyl-accepting chemotaxis protein
MGDQARELQQLMAFFKLDERGAFAGTAAPPQTRSKPRLASLADSGSSPRPVAVKSESVKVFHAVKPTPIKTHAAGKLTPAAKKPSTKASTAEEWEEF